MNVFALTSDLMFGSQMSAAARSAGATLATLGSADGLVESLSGEQEGCLVVLDMTCGAAKKDVAGLVVGIRAAHDSARIVAFGPHVQESLLTAATDAGCDIVMTRGKFHREMDQLFAAG